MEEEAGLDGESEESDIINDDDAATATPANAPTDEVDELVVELDVTEEFIVFNFTLKVVDVPCACCCCCNGRLWSPSETGIGK